MISIITTTRNYFLFICCFITLVECDSVGYPENYTGIRCSVNPGPAVTVEAPPAAIWAKKIYMVRKQDLELRCTVALPRRTTDGDLAKKFINSNPTSVVWLKDNSPISEILTEDEDFLIIAQRLLLKPHKDAERLEGDYSCNSSWSNVGSLVSPAVTVHLAGFKKLRSPDQRTTKIVYALLNNTAFIPCIVPESKPNAVKVWYSKDNVSDIIEAGSSGLNHYVSQMGMQISSVGINVETQGHYICSVTNPVNGQTRESKPIQLTIDNSTKTFSPIKVVSPEQKSTKLEVNAGDDITLECVMTGLPTPAIFWEKYGGSLPDGRFKQNLGNLHLFNVSKSDDGTYVCKAGDVSKDDGNKYHQQWPFIVYTLNVNEPVKATLLVTKSTEYEEAWQLTCKSTGGRATYLLWYFNGQLLLNKGFKPLDQSFDGGDNPKWSLTLKGPLMDGFYQCLVRSPNGDFSDSDNFLVTSSTDFDDLDQMTTSGMEDNDNILTTYDLFLPQIVQGPENTTTFENVAVTMICRVARENSVIWLKDNSELNWGGRYSLIGSGSLEILSVSMNDKGWYTCVALNAQGNATANAFLNIESPMISVGSSDLNTDHYIDPDDGDYNDDDKLLITDASNEITVVTTPSPAHLNKKKKLKVQLEAPKVYRMSNTSVLLKWDMPSNEALPGEPQLFKVQYKKVKSMNKWVTVDMDLPDYSRSHSIDGLEPGAKYKFRIGVVFDNDLQAVSKSSPKFILTSEPEISAPTSAPILQKTVPISPSAIEVFWEHPITETAFLEGFIINYRRLYAGAPTNLASYQNETVIGGNTREHVLTHLLPATPYEIKLSAFNSAGRSRISQPMVQSTLTEENITSDGTLPPLTFLPALITTETAKKNASMSKFNPSSNGQLNFLGLNQETILLIVGVVLGCMLILVIIVTIFCCRKERKKDKVVIATSKGKFRDTSKRIYREQSVKNKLSNNLYSPTSNKNLLKNNNLPPPPSVTGYATNGHIVNLYSNPLDTAVDEGQLGFIDPTEELTNSIMEAGLVNKNNIYKNYLDVSMSDRSNSTASQHSERSKSNGTNGSNKPIAEPSSRSPLLMASSLSAARTGSASTAVDSQYLWTRGSSPRPGERRSWNISSSPPNSLIESAVDSRNYFEPSQDNNKQFYTFKPERSPHHSNGSHQQTRRFGDHPKKLRLSDGYHSDA